MIIDGKNIAREILESVSKQQAMLPRPLVICAVTVAPNPATKSYLGIKRRAAERAGMQLEVVELEDAASSDEIIAAITASTADAIIVQLPLPAHLDETVILNHLPLDKDADVLSEAAREKGLVLPPVAAAVKEILNRAGVPADGKRAVVIGEGWLVGVPVAAVLNKLGAHVLTCNEETFTTSAVQEAILAADIVVSGAGSPHFITPAHIKEGAVLIDAGTSEKGGEIAGDIDPACAEKASVFTPVPGGVGPIAVACLLRNVASLGSGIHG